MPDLAHPTASTHSRNSISGKLQMEGLPEDEKVAQLIKYVRQLPNATFIRNGKDYSPGKAADHLESKYKKHKKKAKTAQVFIDKLATKSSSKESYKIRFSNGETVNLSDLLNKELARIEGR